MTQLLDPSTFEFFARYLLAGYVVIIVRSRFVAGLRPNTTELIVEAVIFGLVVQMLVEAVAWLAAFQTWWGPAPSERLDLLLDVLVYPTGLGLVLGWNLSRGWNRSILRRLSVPVTHPIQRGHDFAFGQNRPAGFVILTYQDGAVIRGWFGESSLAASDPYRSDLYLERIYTRQKTIGSSNRRHRDPHFCRWQT